MAQVGYIEPGKSIHALNWHALFQRLEDILAALFDSKSPFITGITTAASSDLFGERFYFLNGTPVYSTTAANYDHTVYEAIAAAATEVSRDSTLMIMTVDGIGTDLENSLEAHTRDGHYLLANGLTFPEKKYKYAVAELVYEGSGYGAVVIPDTWNKYNFFRIHNLNNYEMTVDFGGHHQVTVPALGCKAVRRTSVSSGYDSTWSYLWRMKSGDPRFLEPFTTAADPNWVITGGKIYRSMRANNCAHPAILYTWIDSLENGIDVGVDGHPRLWRDPHVYYDIQELYVPDYFPDPADTAQLFGNFLHHKGYVTHDGTNYPFNGYETIQTDFAFATFDDQPGSLTMTDTSGLPAIQITTNIFSGATPSTTAYGGNMGFTFANTNTGETDWENVDLVNVPTAVPHSVLVVNADTLQRFVPSSTKVFAPHRDTLATVLTLDHWGRDDYAPGQSTTAQTISGQTLALTPWGPLITFTQNIALLGSAGDLTLFDDPDPVATSFVGGSLVVKQAVQFHGWGWGRLDPVQPAFLSPRTNRAYSSLNGVGVHPNLENAAQNAEGADFDLTPVYENFTEIDYAFLTSIGVYTGSQPFSFWNPPDTIRGINGLGNPTEMIRVPLLVEHFNAMAAYVNSVKKIEPVSHLYSGTPAPNLNGIAVPSPGGAPAILTVCPREMYASFASGSAEEAKFIALGVPIRTNADFPQDWQDALVATTTLKEFQRQMRDTVIARTYLSGSGGDGAADSIYRYTYERTEQWTAVVDADTSYSAFWLLAGFPVPSLYWVKIADVKAAVEALGWKFKYEVSSVPFSIQSAVIPSSPSTLHDPFPLPDTWTEDRNAVNNPNEVGEWIELGRFQSFSWAIDQPYWKQDPAGEWKGWFVDDVGHGVVDLQPGDIVTAWLVNIAHYKVYTFAVDAEYRMSQIAGDSTGAGLVHGSIPRRRHFLHQCYYSTGFTNETQAALIPLQYARHAQDDFSAVSYANAKDAFDDGASQITLEEGAKSGSPTSQTLSANENTVSYTAGARHEIVLIPNCYVSV